MLARDRLPRTMRNRLLRGRGAEAWRRTTNNLNGFRALKLRPRVLVDVSRRSLATSVQWTVIKLPVMTAPSDAH